MTYEADSVCTPPPSTSSFHSDYVGCGPALCARVLANLRLRVPGVYARAIPNMQPLLHRRSCVSDAPPETPASDTPLAGSHRDCRLRDQGQQEPHRMLIRQDCRGSQAREPDPVRRRLPRAGRSGVHACKAERALHGRQHGNPWVRCTCPRGAAVYCIPSLSVAMWRSTLFAYSCKGHAARGMLQPDAQRMAASSAHRLRVETTDTGRQVAVPTGCGLRQQTQVGRWQCRPTQQAGDCSSMRCNAGM